MLDIRDIDYRIQGYHKDKIHDKFGDLVQVDFYKNYNLVTGEYSDLRVRENRTVIREDLAGIPIQLIVNIEWYKKQDVLATKRLEKNLNLKDGMKVNEQSRKTLIVQAQEWVLNDLSYQYGAAQGLWYGQMFLAEVSKEMTDYIRGSRPALIEAIKNTTVPYIGEFSMQEPQHTRKEYMNFLLDVVY